MITESPVIRACLLDMILYIPVPKIPLSAVGYFWHRNSQAHDLGDRKEGVEEKLSTMASLPPLLLLFFSLT